MTTMMKSGPKARPTCVFCKRKCENEYGNNPAPFAKAGARCCNECNDYVVITGRMALLLRK